MKVLLTLTAILLTLVSGCSDDVNSSAGLEYRFEVLDVHEQPSSRFLVGEEVRLLLSASNSGNELEILYFSSGQEVDYELTTLDGETLWRWSDEQVFTAALHDREVQPLSEISHQTSFCTVDTVQTQEGSDCLPVSIGEYRIRGWFLDTGVELQQSIYFD